MENKKIYVDGVDVSKCMYYSKKQQIYSATKPLCKMKDCCMLSDSVSLCLEKDCYYKQLKRAKVEIEELKQESENYAIQLGVLAQALEDIREKCQITDVFGAKDIRDILDKINEVIGAE